MLFLCGFGYWMQGFRCFPWLALNFHMAHNLNMHPSWWLNPFMESSLMLFTFLVRIDYLIFPLEFFYRSYLGGQWQLSLLQLKRFLPVKMVNEENSLVEKISVFY
ncbi:hypothetical protein PRUPE_1G052100 [Prunus persica]|uniref:Uncharacterized protein n=1 Tax=Prunus persica TaxID=3760 RepID=A0A251QSS7_PRUPE|nr:hypothetical protein PRUPE_1G052100 [Prunus persica]